MASLFAAPLLCLLLLYTSKCLFKRFYQKSLGGADKMEKYPDSEDADPQDDLIAEEQVDDEVLLHS